MKLILKMMVLIGLFGLVSTSCSTDEPIGGSNSESYKGNTDKITVSANEDGALTGNGLVFKIVSVGDNECSVQGFSKDVDTKNYNGVLTIPAYVEYKGVKYSVVEITEKAFAEVKGQITYLNLPSTLKRIKDRAFSAFPSCDICCHLEKLVIPTGVEEIGKLAFGVSCIKELVLPENIEIGEGAFIYNDELITLKLSKNTNVGSEAFACNFNLTSITLSGNTKLGYQVFTPNKNLKIFLYFDNKEDIIFEFDRNPFHLMYDEGKGNYVYSKENITVYTNPEMVERVKETDWAKYVGEILPYDFDK